MKDVCEKCFKARHCELVVVPGSPKGKRYCRKCHKWIKKMLEALGKKIVEIDTNIDQEAVDAAPNL